MADIADHGVRFGRIAAMLPVTDIDKAHAFYADILGFTKVFENGSPVGFMILKRDAAELHLTLQPQHKAADFNVAHLLVDDAEALFLRCKTAGLRIIKGLQDNAMMPAEVTGECDESVRQGAVRPRQFGQQGHGILPVRQCR